MADSSDVLLALIREQRDQIRQIESQRAVLTNVVVLTVAAGLGFISQRGLTDTALTITIPMTLLGLYGAVACLKYHERSRLHGAQAHQLRLLLMELHTDLNVEARWSGVFRDQRAAYPLLNRLRLYVIWVTLHLGICLVGLALTVVVLVS
ncbi:hypothetical protein [Streptomyces sp. NPDC087300]|uniref:hypothetical protein n=1 Tax=Streptomyces sp. NPDC087300 TaxID=3365780 RepID=UPI0037F3427E